jgi:hypothetical protein
LQRRGSRREREAQLAAGLQPHYQESVATSTRLKRLNSAGVASGSSTARQEGAVGFTDLVFGPLEVDCAVIGDFIVRSTGRRNTASPSSMIPA